MGGERKHGWMTEEREEQRKMMGVKMVLGDDLRKRTMKKKTEIKEGIEIVVVLVVE